MIGIVLPLGGGFRAPPPSTCGGTWPAGRWTLGVPLPGGDMPRADFQRFEASLAPAHPRLHVPLRHQYARAYGTRIASLPGAAATMADLGAELAPGLHEAEVEYLRRDEFARTVQDILWRRTKLALHLPRAAAADLEAWIAAHPA